MQIAERIKSDVASAMKAGERDRVQALRLVLSARWQAGDLGASGWQTRLGWERNVRVQSRALPVLTREGVRDLLLQMGAPMDVLGRVDELFDDDPRSHEMNSSQKGLAQFLIAGRNAAKLFELVKEPFHLLT